MQVAKLYSDRLDEFKIQWLKQACKTLCVDVWYNRNKIDGYPGDICFKTVEQDEDAISDCFTDQNGTKTRYARNKLNLIE